ncbi:PLP-dependent aminotransferase family protein [Salidesulfovibrio onnuriiensis]|uniref:aminotransferase-like domain-containing protein n=1 Tax=Salidesulfovibrio onnuriiensis TaxID=2583823 RepID=UPI00202B6C7D|nr:PLP-dependent aminotransferase family protein [Salidesulfovibrio onnuriiensis]
METEGPLYKELADSIERDVCSGRLCPGQKLPTHRDLADALGINVSTVTRGYREAERRGLVAGTVGRGTYVASDATTASAMVSVEPLAPGLAEMGLVTPLYEHDPDASEALLRLGRRKDLARFLKYTDPAGLRTHREAGVQWAAHYGLKATPEDMVVCAGSQHALSCSLNALFAPGQRIATDSLTYPGIKSLASMNGLRLAPIPMDEQGMTPEGLDTACRRDDIHGLYLMPDFHNPTALSMPESRRDALAEVALRHNLLLMEDDAYALTCERPGRPMAARMPDRSVHFSGVSKGFWAGLRVAFLTAAKPLRRKIVEAVLNTIWMAPTLNAELVSMWIADGTAEKVLQAKKREAAARMDIAREVLPRGAVHGQPSGFFIWLELPEPWTGTRFEARAREAGINLFCAEKFVVGDAPAPRAVRLSLTGARTHGDLRAGLEKLRDVMDGNYAETVPML